MKLEAVSQQSGTRQVHIVTFLYGEDTELFIEDHALAFKSTTDLIEVKETTILSFYSLI